MGENLKQFKHGSERTHIYCNRRFKELGVKATCCVCDPHLPCDLRPKANMKKPDANVKKYRPIKLF